MRTVRGLAADGTSVVVVVHDLNLAAAYSDRVVLLSRGRIVADGTPAEVIHADQIESVHQQPVTVMQHPTRECPMVVPIDPA